MAGKKWSFRVAGETIVLCPPGEGGGDTKQLAPVEAAWAIESIPSSVPVNDAVVSADLAAALSYAEGTVGAAKMPFEDLRAAVGDAVRRGKLVAFRTSRPMRVQREVVVQPLGPEESPEEVLDIFLLAAEVKQIGDGDKPLIEHDVNVIDPDTGEIVANGTTDEKGIVRVEVPKKKTYRIEIVDLDPQWYPQPSFDTPPPGVIHFRLVDETGQPLAQKEVKAKVGDQEMTFVTDDDGEVSAGAHLGPYELVVDDQSFYGHSVLASDDADGRVYEFEVHGKEHDAGDSDDPTGRLERYDVAWYDDLADVVADDEESLA